MSCQNCENERRKTELVWLCRDCQQGLPRIPPPELVVPGWAYAVPGMIGLVIIAVTLIVVLGS